MSVYFDHNATAPLHSEAREAMLPILAGTFGNPSSLHGLGQAARAMVEASRDPVAALVGGEDGRIVFTGSGTEAVVTAVTGGARVRSAGSGHVVLSAVEHRAGREAGRLLERAGYAVTRVAPDPATGRLNPASIEEALRADTLLVSVVHADSETGILQPVEEIAGLCHAREIIFHTDAVQTAGKVALNAARWGADLVSLSAHKLGGPGGVGALWVRRGVAVDPLIPGTQEGGMRGGTQNLAGIAGFAAAARQAHLDQAVRAGRLAALRDRLERGLENSVPTAVITGKDGPRLPNTTHVTFGENPPRDLVVGLDLEGFAVSAGSACSSGSEEPSPVLLALGMSAARARGAVRVSLGAENTEAEVDLFVETLARLVGGAR